MKFKVTITEVLQKKVDIEAPNEQYAIANAKNRLLNNIITLDEENDFLKADFKAEEIYEKKRNDIIIQVNDKKYKWCFMPTIESGCYNCSFKLESCNSGYGFCQLEGFFEEYNGDFEPIIKV